MKTPLSPDQLANLPTPDPDALAHSEACAAMLRAEVESAGGWLSFATWMERALYAPGLGYYAAGARKFGQSGDFITAPEISPLFGQCVGNAIADTIRATGGDVLELGPGSGKLACDVLRALDACGALPRRYLLLEVSADLIERQRAALASLPPQLAERAEWINTLPTDFVGAMVANEVLDVVPVHLVSFAAGWVFERGVIVDHEGNFTWRDIPALDRALRTAVAPVQAMYPHNIPPEGYLTEFSPAVSGLVTSLAASLKLGVMLLVDYGFRRAEYYHRDRDHGTLMCHYRHYAHPDPFQLPGLTDITSHVDFTTVAETAVAAGLDLLGYTSQAQFLLAAGITELMGQMDQSNTADWLALTNQAQRLLSPAEMGEFFKVIGFARGDVGIGALERARPLPL